MKFMYVVIKLKVKELLSYKSYIAVLSLLPIIMGLLGIYGRQQVNEVRLRAGIFIEEKTPLAVGLKEILLKDESIQFIEFETVEAIEKAVATANVECGFVVKPSIEQAVHTMGQEASIMTLVSPATVASGPIQETVGAAFFRLTSDEIALEVLKGKTREQDTSRLKKQIEKKVEAYYKKGDLMQIQCVVSDNRQENALKQQESDVLGFGKGIISLFLFVASMLLGVSITRERKSGFYKYCKGVKGAGGIIEYALLIASSIYQFVAGGLSLYLFYGLLDDLVLGEVIEVLGALGIYIVAMNSLILLVSSVIKEEQIWMGFIPILSIASIIFSPIIIDLTIMDSVLSYGSYMMLPYYYLTGKNDVLVGIFLGSIVGYMLMNNTLKSFKRHVDILSNREVGVR